MAIWPWNLMDDLKKQKKTKRAPLLHYVKLCALFQIHRWIQIAVTVRKSSIRVKIGEFLSRVTLTFDRWPWRTIEHLFYTTPSSVHNFKAMGEFKLELRSGNTQFWSKSVIFLVPCDLEIWWMTLKNNRAHLLFYIKPCASLQSHQWIETWGTVWKRSIRVKISDFLSPMTLKFNGRPWKTIGYLSQASSSFVHHFIIICEFKLELWSGKG